MDDKGRETEQQPFVDFCLDAGQVDSECQDFVDLQVFKRVYHEEKFLVDEYLEQGLVDREVMVFEKSTAERKPDYFIVQRVYDTLAFFAADFFLDIGFQQVFVDFRDGAFEGGNAYFLAKQG